jgi:hypothetical protein
MMTRIFVSTVAGMAAGVAGTTALNAVTYADMAWRGRPSSSAPSEAVERAAKRLNVTVPGDGEERENRVSALGALAGIATGAAAGAAYGAARAFGWRPPVLLGGLITAAVAMAGADGPLVALDVTDPGSWSAADWLSDAVPHLAYGIVTAGTYAALRPAR